jgi:hypothetical protein
MADGCQRDGIATTHRKTADLCAKMAFLRRAITILENAELAESDAVPNG